MRLTTLLIVFALAVPAHALEPIPDKLVVLTFDDASKSHVTVAAPLLKKHGFGATFFVTEGFDFPTDNGCRVVAVRDLARFVDRSVVPSNPWGVIEKRKKLLSSDRDDSNTRPAR
jgi:hypothetical protein